MPAKDTPWCTRSSMTNRSSEPWLLPRGESDERRRNPNIDWLFDRLTIAQESIQSDLTRRGFAFAPHADGLQPLLRLSARLLASVESLETVIERSVREIVLINAPAGFDISHSEPRWPTTVFVSISTAPGQVSALRVLENIVHEGMHLELTELEKFVPLVADEASKMSSPWREEPRHLQGVLHGAFVFNCIYAFFGKVQFAQLLDRAGKRYVAKRRREISEELQKVDFDLLGRGLTPEGATFLNGHLRWRTRCRQSR
jgi:hypothetical protein